MNPQQNWRTEIVRRNVLAGRQGQCDLEGILANGVVPKPKSCREARRICLDMAKEYVPVVEAGKRLRKDIPDA